MRYLIKILILLAAVNALSQSRYELPCRADLLTASRDSLFRQVGTKETGKNGGDVKKYWVLFSKTPIPYCSAAQWWCFYTSAKDLKIGLKEIPIIRTALANAVYDDAAKRGVKTAYIAKDNDLIVWRNKGSYTGHIERVIEVKNGGNVRTIGFNTGNGNARDGDGVHIRNRNIYHILGRMHVRGLVGFKVLR